MKKAFIIQARSGSTRLPDKMNRPFYGSDSILDIIVLRLKSAFPEIPIVLATTSAQKDDTIEARGQKYGVAVFRGSEEDVLSRFVDAATHFNITEVIRICADNPFISVAYLEQLIAFYDRSSADYVSYMSEKGNVAMKTHYGFFAEIVSREALIKASNETTDKFFREHVTNFIYGNPQLFSLSFLPIPKMVEHADVRLTVDTLDDFRICQKIYSQLTTTLYEPSHILHYIQQNPELKKVMEHQINLNKK